MAVSTRLTGRERRRSPGSRDHGVPSLDRAAHGDGRTTPHRGRRPGRGAPMATPEYVPEPALVRVRMTAFAGIPPPRRLPPRPDEMLVPPQERGFGVPCPDSGYGFLVRLQLAPG